MDIKKIVRVGVDWIDLSQDRKNGGLFWTQQRHLDIIKSWEFPDWVKDH
jgi:hypothetical protein